MNNLLQLIVSSTRLVAIAALSLGLYVATENSHAAIYMTEFNGGSIVDIAGGGDFSATARYAFGLSGPMGMSYGPNGDIYVVENSSGEVTVISGGGDFSATKPFAFGLTRPVGILWTGDRLLVALNGTGEVIDITAGGDFSATTPFAFGLNPQLVGLMQDSNGTIWASSQFGGTIVDITLGGDFSAVTPFASNGVDTRGMAATPDGRLLVADQALDKVIDFTGGGDLSALPVFATLAGVDNVESLGVAGLFAFDADAQEVYEISGGGDFSAVSPFAFGLRTGGGYAAMISTVVPIPVAVWLFGSGLIGLIGIARRNRA